MRGVEAEAVIEWVDHHLAVILTSTQKDLIRIYVGENAARPWAPNSYAQGGHRFAELLVAEYCEEMDHSAREKGTGMRTMRHCVLCASGAHEESVHGLAGFALGEAIYDEVLARRADDWAGQLAAKLGEACTGLELVHGHGPAEVVWSNDYETYQSKARVKMPYSEDCAVCQAQRNIEKLREGNDG